MRRRGMVTRDELLKHQQVRILALVDEANTSVKQNNRRKAISLMLKVCREINGYLTAEKKDWFAKLDSYFCKHKDLSHTQLDVLSNIYSDYSDFDVIAARYYKNKPQIYYNAKIYSKKEIEQYRKKRGL
jgi:hypothetical protein